MNNSYLEVSCLLSLTYRTATSAQMNTTALAGHDSYQNPVYCSHFKEGVFKRRWPNSQPSYTPSLLVIKWGVIMNTFLKLLNCRMDGGWRRDDHSYYQRVSGYS